MYYNGHNDQIRQINLSSIIYQLVANMSVSNVPNRIIIIFT